MLYLNDPLDLINIILIILASIEAAYLYKVTHKPSFILYFTAFYVSLVFKLILEHPFLNQCYVIILYLMVGYMLYAFYRDKLWSLFAIGSIGFILFNMVLNATQLQMHGEGALFIMILGWMWYKSTPICFNPFTNPKCKIESIK